MHLKKSPMSRFVLFSFFFILTAHARSQADDQEIIRRIFTASLENGQSYENLRHLCKDVGNRLTGSHGDSLAVQWGYQKMKELGYENVRLQEFETNYWVRGEGASGKIIDGKEVIPVHLLALGGSVGTEGKNIRAGVIQIDTWEELENRKSELQGKIVFYNRRMDPKNVNTFLSYGATVDQRWSGAMKAAEYGAVAALVRSVTLKDDEHPHTGSMGYSEDIVKVPGIAISGKDANVLEERLSKNPRLEIEFTSDCKNLGTVKSSNVIGEIPGSEFPDEYIVIGGHLDSWDVGEGAHDDGAGIVHAMEILHLLKEAGYQARHTIRCVLFMNEENGVGGGKIYAKEAGEKGEKHLAAFESDAGGFSPRGFHVEAADSNIESAAYDELRSWSGLLAPYNLHYFNKSHAGTDIHRLKDLGSVNFGLIPDSQRYFDYHHTTADVFEAVNERELELGAASMAALVYLVDRYGIAGE